MLPGASTIKEEAYFNEVSAGEAPTPQAFFDFFAELLNFVVLRGVNKTFSALEFSSLGSFPLFRAGGLGDGNLGDTGGDNNEVLVLQVEVGEVGVFGKLFGRDFLLSKLGTWLQVG